jgi:hypothetical protein
MDVTGYVTCADGQLTGAFTLTASATAPAVSPT